MPIALNVLGLDLSQQKPWQQLIGLSIGVFITFLLYGYLQELIFSLEGFKPFGWFLTFIQFCFYSIFGLLELFFISSPEHRARRIPLHIYALIAALTVTTMACSNMSVAYLNYPTQVIFKSCKLIPVMIGGILIQGKRYGLVDAVAANLMTVGLIFFTLADVSLNPSFDPTGVALISLALAADAVIGNVQEKNMKTYGSNSAEMVLYSYAIGSIYLLMGLLVNGNLFDALHFCWMYPIQTYGYAAAFSLTGYLGVNVVLTLVKTFGALVAVTITTCRKAVTIVLSFVFFAKPFSQQYIWSGLLVMAGIYLNVYAKNSQPFQKAFFACTNLILNTLVRKNRQFSRKDPDLV